MARPSDQALVSDQAATQLDPPGFDPLRFAKLFDTPHGQLLVFLDETEDQEPAITVIGACVRGVRPKATLSGWPEGEEAQLRNFEKTDQAMADDFAAALYRSADSLAPRDSDGSPQGEDGTASSETTARAGGIADTNSTVP